VPTFVEFQVFEPTLDFFGANAFTGSEAHTILTHFVGGPVAGPKKAYRRASLNGASTCVVR
jgi:hypothetical protein